MRTNQAVQIDPEARITARGNRNPTRPSDTDRQTNPCRDCGEAIRDRDVRAIPCLDCARLRKNARGHTNNKANRGRLHDYGRKWR